MVIENKTLSTAKIKSKCYILENLYYKFYNAG